jgi:hypothetical protein
VIITRSEKNSLTNERKRRLSEASGSLRAKKAAKVINDKVVTTQLQKNSNNAGRKRAQLHARSPIVSRSPVINLMARKRAQMHARAPIVATVQL